MKICEIPIVGFNCLLIDSVAETSQRAPACLYHKYEYRYDRIICQVFDLLVKFTLL